MLIGGEWVRAADGAVVEVEDPATGLVVATVPAATPADLDAALAASVEGFQAWRSVDPWSRSAVLRRVAELVRARVEEIARVLTEEAGKPLGESRAEVLAAADQFDWFSDAARRVDGRVVEARSPDLQLLVRREPVGPVAAFAAWNFPALLPARKLAPALAAGCSVLLKPAEEAPRATLELARACLDAGVPAGAVGAVTGDPARISRHLIGSGAIRKVSLTGSVAVGRAVGHLAAQHLVPTTMELGGQAPVLVFEDADLDHAAETIVRAKFRNCGQVCISPSRVLVHRSRHDALVERLVARCAELTVGAGLDPRTDVGPLASCGRRDAVEALVADALERGAVAAVGGRRPPERSQGWFYEPTVLDLATDDMAVMREEPFGPLAPVSTFEDTEEAVARANATPYGLAGYLFTRDLRTAFEVAEALEVGMVGVNELVIATAEMPFGGVKQSGFGREGGTEAMEAYTCAKAITIRT
jgi:succinate-semialdehyde dehydrogenase/glutarate-semialdehyde dehydrogenase